MTLKNSNSLPLIDAILFDLGNVLINYTFIRTFEKWADLTLHSLRFFQSQFQFDQKLYEYEVGSISSNEYFAYLTTIFGIEWNFEVFEQGWNNIHIGVPDGIVSLLKLLQSKYPLYILSNTNALHASYWKTHYSNITIFFTEIFCSHELRCHKPDPLIYQKLLTQIRCEPHKVLFFDDVMKNVIGAKKVGIEAYMVKNPQEMRQILERRGIL